MEILIPIFGIALVAFIISKVFGFARYRLDQKYGDKLTGKEKQRLEELEAFRQRAEKRLQVLESIVVENDNVIEKDPAAGRNKDIGYTDEDPSPLKNMLRS